MRRVVLLAVSIVLVVACGDAPRAVTVEPGSIIGRIEKSDDVPLATCKVTVEGYPVGSRCDELGGFRHRALPPGAWTLRIAEDPPVSGEAPVRRIPAASNSGFVSDVGAIRIAQPGAVTGRVTGGDITYAVLSVPHYGVATAPGTSGGYLLQRVPVGTHDIVLTTLDGGTLRADVQVRPGDLTVDINFDLADLSRDPVEVSGTAVRADGDEDGNAGLTVGLVELRNGTVAASAITAADGAWSLTVTPGIFLLRARDGDSPLSATIQFVVVVGAGGLVVEQRLVVPRPGGDLDGDGVPDDTDGDDDDDGVPDPTDAFPYDAAETVDTDGDGLGDNADLQDMGGPGIDARTDDTDTDGDGWFDYYVDICPTVANPGQEDFDGDRVGDVCDNCVRFHNPDQADSDGDLLGDACETCIENEPCRPGNPCNRGRTTCIGGAVQCVDTGIAVPAGTSCGTGMVCNGSACGVCNAGESCEPPGLPCHDGIVSCTSGMFQCVDQGSFLMNGIPCGTGTGQVCSDGDCVPCVEGAMCPLANDDCHLGALSCGQGLACNPTTMTVMDGTACGTGGQTFCRQGACVACSPGALCEPADECHVGSQICTTPTPTCADTLAPVMNGQPCDDGPLGEARYCITGACTDLPDTMTFISGGTQMGYAGAQLALTTVQILDGTPAPVPNAQVTITPPPGGAVIGATTIFTGADGRVSFQARLGPTIGVQQFQIVSLVAPPITLTATAIAPPATGGSTAVNVDGIGGSTGDGGPASLARVNQVTSIASASDGSYYLVDRGSNRVRRVSAAGVIGPVAGNGSTFSTGDFGPAVDAGTWGPLSVVLDEGRDRLYLSENGRVRVIDLSSGIIAPFAGGGAIGYPTYGDGGDATLAVMAPAGLARAPDGALIVADIADGRSRVRRIDATSRVVTTLSTLAACGPGAALGAVQFTAGNEPAALAVDAGGSIFFGASLCGTRIGGTAWGIVRRDPSGTLHHVGGRVGGSTASGIAATSFGFGPITDMELDAAGNLVVSDLGNDRVYRIDGRSGVVTPVAGTGAAGPPGPEYSDATQSPLSDPIGLALVGDDLLVGDTMNLMVRRIADVGIATATPVSLALTSGSGQPVRVTERTPLPLVATLSAGSPSGPVRGADVHWSGATEVALSSATDTTDSLGRASITARMGLAPGMQTITASYRDLHGAHVSGSPVSYAVTVNAASGGTITTVINNLRLNGGAVAALVGPTAAVEAPVPESSACAAAPDGTLFAGTRLFVYRVTPAGVLTRIAGSGATTGGDGGLALDAGFEFLTSTTYDPVGGDVYVLDTNLYAEGAVRRIDLASGYVDRIAGGGFVGAPTYGDGGPADQATILSGASVLWGDDGNLYVGDANRGIRQIDLGTGLIDLWLPFGAGDATLSFVNCSSSNSCAMVADGVGGFYLAGLFAGTAVNTAVGVNGVVHVSSTGMLTRIAGFYGGASTPGTLAGNFEFGLNEITGLARAGSDLLVMSGDRLWRIPGSTVNGAMTHVAGGGAAGPIEYGDLGPATSASFAAGGFNPVGLCALPDGRPIIVDPGHFAFRRVE